MRIGGIIPEFVGRSSNIGPAAKIAYGYLFCLSVEFGADEVDATGLASACAMTQEEAAYSLGSLCIHHFIEPLLGCSYRIVDGKLLRDQYAKQEEAAKATA